MTVLEGVKEKDSGGLQGIVVEGIYKPASFSPRRLKSHIVIEWFGWKCSSSSSCWAMDKGTFH